MEEVYADIKNRLIDDHFRKRVFDIDEWEKLNYTDKTLLLLLYPFLYVRMENSRVPITSYSLNFSREELEAYAEVTYQNKRPKDELPEPIQKKPHVE